MTGLGPGPDSPILQGYLPNFVFMITLLLILLLSLLFARRLINTKPSMRGFAIVRWSLLLVFVCLLVCSFACLLVRSFACSFVRSFICLSTCPSVCLSTCQFACLFARPLVSSFARSFARSRDFLLASLLPCLLVACFCLFVCWLV